MSLFLYLQLCLFYVFEREEGREAKEKRKKRERERDIILWLTQEGLQNLGLEQSQVHIMHSMSTLRGGRDLQAWSVTFCLPVYG